MKKGVRVKNVAMAIVRFAEGVCMAFVLSKAILVIVSYLFFFVVPREKKIPCHGVVQKIQPNVEGCLNKILGLNKVAHI